MSPEVIDHLKSFNRKERFLLLCDALGFDNQTFHLSEEFINKLSGCIGCEIPRDSYVAMDYHLDWLQMALYLASEPSPPDPILNDRLVEANQEDIDLLVAFGKSGTTHLVLIEAKGDTGWTNKQLKSKADRLKRISNEGRPGTGLVKFHFVMLSPNPPKQIKVRTWPDWMKPHGEPLWLPLRFPKGLRKVTRCKNDKSRTRSKGGRYLRLDQGRHVRPTIVDILGRNPEPLPEWLAGDNPPRFDRNEFFAARTVYYPGSGDDGQPVKLCALAHAAHTFIYVDQGVEQEALAERLQDRERGFRGYAITHQEQVSEEVLRPCGWIPHVSAEEASSSHRFRDGFTEPFGWFVVLDRQGGNKDHGPSRLAILFIGGDGIASYDALFCQRDGTPAPFLTVIQDHGFGSSYERFDRHGLLERIAQRSGVWPEYLLVGRGSNEWLDYTNTGSCPEPGGSGAHPRSLFRRRGNPR